MKKIAVLLFFIFPGLAFSVVEPMQIPLKFDKIMSLEWYAEQAILWSAKTRENAKEPNTWYNYYSASRFAKVSQEELNEIVKDMGNQVPQSFEYDLVHAWNSGYDNDALQSLKSAYAKEPENPLTYGEFMTFYELMGDRDERKNYAQKLYQKHFIPQGLLNYNYNVLMSVENDGYLFTQGDNATIPLWILQDVLQIRRDIKVLNIDLLKNDEYRNQIFRTESIQFNTDKSTEFTETNYQSQILKQLPLQNPEKKFFYALTLSNQDIKDIKNDLFVVGLASFLSNESIDNIAFIKRNMEKKFLLDYLKVNFNGESMNSTSRVLSQNYLIPIIVLSEHYRNSGEIDKAEEWEDLALKISEERGKLEEVSYYLSNSQSNKMIYPKYPLEIKEIEKSFKPFTDKLYVSEYEVTNESYNDFLDYLKENNMQEILEICDYDLSGYEEPALSFMKKYLQRFPPGKRTKNANQFENYPVMNVSFEAAVEYCKWLTNQYNSSLDKTHKRVIFRLPNQKEWQMAAFGLKDFTSWNINENVVLAKEKEGDKPKDKKRYDLANYEISYPWWPAFNLRNSPVNNFKCYLGNFKVPDESECPSGVLGDGFTVTSPTGSYFPNEMGLYDVVGNVAEMIDEKGKACGGSWNHPPEESTIHSVNTYESPNSYTGFRVFMEIVE